MISPKSLRRVCIAATVVGLASCALPEMTIDPSLDGQGAAAGNGSNDGGKGGNAAGAGKGNGSSGSSNPGGEGGSDDAGGGTAGTSGGNMSEAGMGGGSGGSGGSTGGNCSQDLTSDEANCGKCGQACEPDQTCSSSKCTGPCGATFAVGAKGFVTAPGTDSCLHGLAFPTKWLSTTTLTPDTFSSCGASCKLCISGTVAPDESYSSYAAIGVAFNQTSTGGTAGTITPKGGDFELSVTNTGGNNLRLWIYGKEGNSDPEQRWCYSLGNQTMTHSIPWGGFNTECWANTGTFYSGAPLKEMMVQAFGDNTDAIPYDFCIDSFKDK